MRTIRTFVRSGTPDRRRVSVGVTAAAALTLVATGVVGASGAAADGEPRSPLLRSGLVGSTPLPAGPTLFGIPPGGAPWVADDDSSVRVDRDGSMVLRVRRLVIPTPPANGTNPVPLLSASLVCNGAIAATTGTVPFDTRGNALLRQTVTVPTTCLAPAVLVHPGANTGVYIAASG